MAAPAEVTIHNLSGQWTMNKTLSDNQDAILSLQGIGWLTRKAVGLATVTLTIKQEEVDGVMHIGITSVASGLSSSQEDRVLSWAERTHSDKLFGNVKGKSRMIKKSEYDPAVPGVTEDEKKFATGEKAKDGSATNFLDEDLIQTVAYGQDSTPWEVDQVWGFEIINGERRYTRRVVGKCKGKTELLRLVYDYNGPL